MFSYEYNLIMQNLKIVSLRNLSNYNKNDEVKMLKYISLMFIMLMQHYKLNSNTCIMLTLRV